MDRLTLNNLSLVDSHLDLAENMTPFGRNLTLSISEIRAAEKRSMNQAIVTFQELMQEVLQWHLL